MLQIDAFGHTPTVKRRGKWAVLFSSATDQHATPSDVFAALSEDVGGFDVDVAADKKNTKCARFFSRKDNGLAQRWFGRCWMNPPYGPRVTGTWLAKAHQEVTLGGADLVCALVPARTDTAAFHDYVFAPGHEVRFIRGRLHFNDAKNSAPFPSAVIWFRRKGILHA